MLKQTKEIKAKNTHFLFCSGKDLLNLKEIISKRLDIDYGIKAYWTGMNTSTLL